MVDQMDKHTKWVDGDIDNKMGMDRDIGVSIDNGWVVEWMMGSWMMGSWMHG